MVKPFNGFLLGLTTLVAIITVSLLVGWAQEKHWLPQYETANCSAYQRGAPHCRGWHENARRQ